MEEEKNILTNISEEELKKLEQSGAEITSIAIENKPDNQAENRNPDGTFKEGVSGNPAGRPKGKTLKEWMRDKLSGMTEEEREVFLKDIPKDMQWRMAEGNPKQDTEHSGSVDSTVTVIKYAKGDNPTPSLPTEKLPDSPVGGI